MEDYSVQTIFLNNALGQFYNSFLQWLSDSFYTDINTKIISTYTKAVKKLSERKAQTDTFDVVLPAVILDPSGEITPDDKFNQLWRYNDLAPDRVANFFEPLYQDEEVMIVPVFNRFVGEMEVTLLLRSIYEYLDMRIYIAQTFKNQDRYNRPFIVYTFLVLPDELINLQYDNLDGTTRGLDWSSANASQKLIKNMNTNEQVVPLVLTPMFKYTGLSDSSNRKAVGTELEDYKITMSIQYEIDLPVYFYIKSDYKVKLPPTISIRNGFAGKEYSFPDSYILEGDPNDPNRPTRQFQYMRTIFFDIENESQLQSIKDNGFVIQEQFDDYQCIKIAWNDTNLDYWDDYIHDDMVMEKIIFRDNIANQLSVGDHIEIAIYKPKG